jgi:hypothetical protein
MSAVEGGHRCHRSSLGGGEDRRVDGSESQVVVPGDELGDADPVAGGDRFGDEVAGGEVTEEADLCVRAEPRGDQERDLGDDERRDEQRAWVGLEQLETSLVVPIVGVDVRVERPGVDDQRDARTSLARISSIRSEMSSRPLDPALAASSLRRLPVRPRCASMASRVSSDTVSPRRSAS